MPTSVDPLTRPGYDSVAVKFGCWLWSIKVDRIFSVDRMLAFFSLVLLFGQNVAGVLLQASLLNMARGKRPLLMLD